LDYTGYESENTYFTAPEFGAKTGVDDQRILELIGWRRRKQGLEAGKN